MRFTRSEPSELHGMLSPHAQITLSAEPRGDGDYSLELRRGANVRQHPGRYYTTEGGRDSFTVDDGLNVLDGCKDGTAR